MIRLADQSKNPNSYYNVRKRAFAGSVQDSIIILKRLGMDLDSIAFDKPLEEMLKDIESLEYFNSFGD